MGTDSGPAEQGGTGSQDVRPGLLRRTIARQFTSLRVRAKLTQKQAAAAIQLSESTLLRIEHGDDRVKFKPVFVDLMLKAYGASAAEREELEKLTAALSSGMKGWWHDFTDSGLPSWFSVYVSMEDSADIIRKYETETVPGLLQTKEYARLIIASPAGQVPAEEAVRRVEARMERQGLLVRARAPRLEVVISEAALARLLGMGSTVARGQLERLLQVGQFPNVSLRLIPWSVGVHGGMGAGGRFSLLQFPEDPVSGEPVEPPLVYVDSSPAGALYLDKPRDIDLYRTTWSDLLEHALDEQDTQQMFTQALEGLPE